MSIQRELLPGLIDACAAIHPHCAVILIGSVARGMERDDSDIDLNVIFPGDETPTKASPYIADDNRWQLQEKGLIRSVRIDVAWETENVLRARLGGDEIARCWSFSQGRVLRDPLGIAEPLVELAREWFARRPDVIAKLAGDYAIAKAEQAVKYGR